MTIRPLFPACDLESIERMAAVPLPGVLSAFLRWVSDAGSWSADQEFVYLEGSWLEDFWIYYGSDLSEYFSFFACMDGDRVGLWFPTRSVPAEDAPVVLIGHEGNTSILGRNSRHFLARLAYDDDLETQLDLLPSLESLTDFRSDLRLWLRENRHLTPDEALNVATRDPVTGLPDLDEWFEQWIDVVQKRCCEDPLLAELFGILASITRDRVGPPHGAFEAVCLAQHFELWEVRFGRQPVLAHRQRVIEPLVRQYRASRAAQIPERGAWFQATFLVSGSGCVPPSCSFEFPPVFGGLRRGGGYHPLDQPPEYNITTEDYLVDLANFPRTSRWMPKWLMGMMAVP